MQGLITKEGIGGCLWHDDNTTLQRQWRSGILTMSPNNPLLLGLFIPFFRSKLLRILSNFKRIVCLLTAYDKLAMYGLRVHGCIDGASHYVLYAKVASNKTQSLRRHSLSLLEEPWRNLGPHCESDQTLRQSMRSFADSWKKYVPTQGILFLWVPRFTIR